MPHHRPLHAAREASRLARTIGPALVAVCALLSESARAETVEIYEGFTEPYRTHHVAAPEPGVVVELLVREGDDVALGQPLVKLDDDLLHAQLAIAELQMKAVGRLQAAEAELALHEQRWEKLVELEKLGQAYPDEVARARADKEAAQGRVVAEREERRLLEKQYEKLQLQIAKRVVKSPAKGKAALVLKYEGEYVSPADPVVAKVVVLDRLRATFFLPRASAERLKVGQKLPLSLPRLGKTIEGEIEHVSALTDAESSAVPVKVLLDNSQGELYSGERAVLELD